MGALRVLQKDRRTEAGNKQEEVEVDRQDDLSKSQEVQAEPVGVQVRHEGDAVPCQDHRRRG